VGEREPVMYHVILQSEPTGTPCELLENADEVAGFVEEWFVREAAKPTGLVPCFTWHQNGTKEIPTGTVS
jgi:hypothetical protein